VQFLVLEHLTAKASLGLRADLQTQYWRDPMKPTTTVFRIRVTANPAIDIFVVAAKIRRAAELIKARETNTERLITTTTAAAIK
jgi:hypothetical protein